MRKLIAVIFILTTVISCKKKESDLFKTTDFLIEKAKSNTLLKIHDKESIEAYPEDSIYTVRLSGSSVIVEINHLPSTDRYIALKNELIERYEGNFDVKNIGLNGFGDIIIQVE